MPTTAAKTPRNDTEPAAGAPKHTPGPWTIVEYGADETPNLVVHRGETENRICFMATPGSHGDSAIIEADARLIAAAPDLLEALEYLLTAGNSPDAIADARITASAAIAKATGAAS